MSKKNLCNKCSGQCCRYFALPIETPETKDDYDDIRWFLCHEGTTVFVEKGDWNINIKNDCRYISEENYTCGIYNKRPKICRSYSRKDCDLADGAYDYDLHFTDDKQMEEYIKIKFDNNITEKQKGKSVQRKKKK